MITLQLKAHGIEKDSSYNLPNMNHLIKTNLKNMKINTKPNTKQNMNLDTILSMTKANCLIINLKDQELYMTMTDLKNHQLDLKPTFLIRSICLTK
jgi:hypothetical protein